MNRCSGCKYSPIRDDPKKEATFMKCESKKNRCERNYWVKSEDGAVVSIQSKDKS